MEGCEYLRLTSSGQVTLVASRIAGINFEPTGGSPKATVRDGGSGGAIVATLEGTLLTGAVQFDLFGVLCKSGIYVTLSNASVVVYYK